MEDVLLEILEELRTSRTTGAQPEQPVQDAQPAQPASPQPLDTKRLLQIIRNHNEGHKGKAHPFAKKQLLPFYLHVKENDRARWESWNIDAALERRLVQTLCMKPRRTASGVATITVLTKPWPCSGICGCG